jgi:hypothetical protein
MGQIALAVEDQRPAGVDDSDAVDILSELSDDGPSRSHALHPQPAIGKPGPAEDRAELGVEAIHERLNCRSVPGRSEGYAADLAPNEQVDAIAADPVDNRFGGSLQPIERRSRAFPASKLSFVAVGDALQLGCGALKGHHGVAPSLMACVRWFRAAIVGGGQMRRG